MNLTVRVDEVCPRRQRVVSGLPRPVVVDPWRHAELGPKIPNLLIVGGCLTDVGDVHRGRVVRPDGPLFEIAEQVVQTQQPVSIGSRVVNELRQGVQLVLDLLALTLSEAIADRQRAVDLIGCHRQEGLGGLLLRGEITQAWELGEH